MNQNDRLTSGSGRSPRPGNNGAGNLGVCSEAGRHGPNHRWGFDEVFQGNPTSKTFSCVLSTPTAVKKWNSGF